MINEDSSRMSRLIELANFENLTDKEYKAIYEWIEKHKEIMYLKGDKCKSRVS